MRLSNFFLPTLRENPKDAECISHIYSLKAGLFSMLSAGIYAYLPLGLRVLNNISRIIRRYMNNAGAVEVMLPALLPFELWQATGRDKTLADVMFKFKDRRQRILTLGPTHEEAITEIAKRYVSSYKQLPLILYQIQTKYRDEIRPRYGLVRSCEFVMKDAYSFDIDQKGLDESYTKMSSAYEKIFSACGLRYVMAPAESGAMGGSVSDEFMVEAQIGEDILYYCRKCGRYYKEAVCPVCKNKTEEKRMIEVGHIFKLDTKYSSAQDACFLDSSQKRRPFIMGCYGIGVSRLIPAVIEQSHDDKGIIWPKEIAPFAATVIVVDSENNRQLDYAFNLEQILEENGFSVLADDRKQKAGVKFNDAYLIGSPYIIIIGKKTLLEEKIEIEKRATGEKFFFRQEELINFLKDEYGN